MFDRKVSAVFVLAVLALTLISARFAAAPAEGGYPAPHQLVSIRTTLKFKDMQRDQIHILLKRAPGNRSFVLTELSFSEDRGALQNRQLHAPRIEPGYDLLDGDRLVWTAPRMADREFDPNPKWFPGLRFQSGNKIRIDGLFSSAAEERPEDYIFVTLVGYVD